MLKRECGLYSVNSNPLFKKEKPENQIKYHSTVTSTYCQDDIKSFQGNLSTFEINILHLVNKLLAQTEPVALFKDGRLLGFIIDCICRE